DGTDQAPMSRACGRSIILPCCCRIAKGCHARWQRRLHRGGRSSQPMWSAAENSSALARREFSFRWGIFRLPRARWSSWRGTRLCDNAWGAPPMHAFKKASPKTPCAQQLPSSIAGWRAARRRRAGHSRHKCPGGRESCDRADDMIQTRRAGGLHDALIAFIDLIVPEPRFVSLEKAPQAGGGGSNVRFAARFYDISANAFRLRP